MFIQINPSNGIPIYDQVVRQIKFALAAGAVRTGELIPSVRELARQLAINPNTVARAYRQLQDEGMLTSLRGTGLQVADGAQRQCRADRMQLIRERIRDVLQEAKRSGLDAEEVRQLVEREMKSWGKKRGA